MSFEWFPWYPALYRAKTMHLTAEQDGIYRRLIDHYMETRQPLPDNDAALARIASITPEVWTSSAETIRQFFKPAKGKLRHKRCDEELERQDGRSRFLSEKGKLGANKRWKNRKENQEADSLGHSHPIATPMPNDSRLQDKTRESIITPKIVFDAGKGQLDGITPDQFKIWKAAYPGVDVNGELLAMEQWLSANPEKRKKNYRAFIVNWLNKAKRDLGGRKVTRGPGGELFV